MYKFLIFLFFVCLGGSLWGVSHQFVEVELTLKWYWTILFATVGFLLIGILYYFISVKKKSCSFRTLCMAVFLCALSQAVYGLLQWLGVCFSNNGFRLTGSFDNPAGIASALAFSVPFGLYLLKDQRRFIRWTAGICLWLIMVVLFLSESRAGMFSGMVIVGVYVIRRLEKRRKIVWTIVCVCLVSMMVVLYHYKKDSADGRLLIWQCTWEMIQEKPILGYGSGGFKANYMDYQAQYFREHPDSTYILLADDVKRPFNEYLWILVDYGVVGGILLLVLIAGCVKLWLRSPGGSSRVAALCLLSIAVFSLFSYPFTYPYTWILGLFSIGILVHNAYSISFKAQRRIFVVITLCMVVLSYFAIKRMRAEMEWCRIANLSLLGETEKVLPIYKELSGELGDVPLFLYNYAAELNVAGYYEESIRVGKECEKRFADYFTQLLLADNYKNLKQYKEARKHWILASEMCPNRFVPLYELYGMYESQGEILRAQQIGNRILKKPVKVQSAEVRRIIEEIKQKKDILIDKQ